MIKPLLIIMLTLITGILTATDYIPLAYAHNFSFDDQNFSGFGNGMVIMKGDDKTEESESRDFYQLAALYTRHNLESSRYNSVDFIFQKKKQRHQYFTVLKSYADKPVYGGLETFDFVSGYGYQVITGHNHSLWLGASLAVSDWGIELGGGNELPVIPLPFLHYDFSSQFIEASFDFTTSPMVDFVLAPEQPWHLNGSVIVTDMENLRNRGMKYDFSAEYRFFDENHPLGDFAGIKMGVQADDYEYQNSGNENTFQKIAWNTVYGTLDLSLLELTAGYIMDSEYSGESGFYTDPGKGFFCRVQLAWMF